MSHARIRYIIYFVIILGMALHLEQAFGEPIDAESAFPIGELILSVAPYAVIILFRNFLYGSLCAVILVFAFDVWMHLEVFVFPRSSTAALGLFFMPLWNLFLVIPLAYFVGSLIKKKS